MYKVKLIFNDERDNEETECLFVEYKPDLILLGLENGWRRGVPLHTLREYFVKHPKTECTGHIGGIR